MPSRQLGHGSKMLLLLAENRIPILASHFTWPGYSPFVKQGQGGSHSAFFNRPHTHSLEMNEVSRLRRFLHEAGVDAAAQTTPTSRTVVIIDHHAARIYQDLGGDAPDRKETLKPYDPYGLGPPQGIRL